MHLLIIKGSDSAAYAACAAHGIDADQISDIDHRKAFNDTIVMVLDTVPVTTLTGWFCSEPYEPPYADGALLWYGPAKRNIFNGNLIVPNANDEVQS